MEVVASRALFLPSYIRSAWRNLLTTFTSPTLSLGFEVPKPSTNSNRQLALKLRQQPIEEGG